MNIVKKIQKVQENFESNLSSIEKNRINDRKNFYQEMLEKGIIIKQDYNLPMVDTIGKKLYQSSTSNANPTW